jgi:O-6-methylguanine DNA methyltransferase
MHKALSLLRKIPKGKVTTYKELARATNSSPRAIGQVMRNNKEPEKYPCYKVVRSDGSIGGYSGETKGKEVKRKASLLIKDGIVVNNNKIDLKKHFHRF